MDVTSTNIFYTPAIVDFPTPPFAEETAMTFRTSRMARFSGRPRWRRGICGGAPDCGSPCNNQSEQMRKSKSLVYQRILMIQRSYGREKSPFHHQTFYLEDRYEYLITCDTV